MPRAATIGIQADDLTGACDAAAPFAARGLETVVLFGDAPLPAPPPAVLALDSGSRECATPEAQARARVAGERLVAAGATILYKKVDSTLRGSIGAELAGMFEGTHRSGAVLAPAFPAQGRRVAAGRLQVDGGPSSRARAHDVTGGNVLAILGRTCGHPLAYVPLATVRAGAAPVSARLGRFVAVFVCDAVTDADLAVLAAATERTALLLAGSAGLATALAERLAPAGGRPAPPLRGPLLVVAGSPHRTTHGQLARLAATGAAVSVLVPPAGEPAAEPAARRAVADRLAAATRRHMATRGVPGTVLLTGGETAASVCRTLGAAGLAVRGEVEPGLAVGALLDGPFAGLVVVTKAGGFGDAETLVRVHQRCT